MLRSRQAPESEQQVNASRSRVIPLSWVWIAAAFAIPVAVIATTPLVSVDLAYLIRAGDIMLDTGGVVREDSFMVWTLGLPWLNQQWGAELVIALAYRAGGWLGLVIVRAAIQAAILGGVFLACRAAGADRRRAGLLTLGSAVLVSQAFLLRAQLLGMACFAVVLWLAEGRRDHEKRAWWVVPVTILWANTHGSFFLAPLLFGLAWIEDVSRKDPRARRTLALAVATGLATFVTPFGPGVWGYVRDVATDSQVVDVVREWRPPTLGTPPGFLFFVSLIAFATLAARRPRPVPWPSLVRLAVFFLIGLAAVRGTVWWGLLLPVEITRLPVDRSRVRADPVLGLNWALVGVLLLTIGISFLRWVPHANQEHPGQLLARAPAEITRRLEQLLRPGERFFHSQEWGSWFELALPRNPVIADSRFEMIPPARWDQYLAISGGRQGWQAILDGWNVRVAVLSYEQQEHLIPLMRRDARWRLAHEDDDGLVFVRA